ncbi:MAG: DNA gyrase subunit A [Chitinophagales bacterium]|nr:DNA gyrase subunit A [Chitinophagales bacterium]
MAEEGSLGSRIIPINIEEEMKTAYIDYSMSVIVSRALPDVRDGLKPVHRRVLFGMQELGVYSNRPYKKSARIVGEVLGKYHPHGDSSVYDTMVRMAQEWSLRYMLVDGQGNFGSVDGDSPAAMRYTEARLRKFAEEMLSDLDKETVDLQLNFDDTLQEPTVLPSKLPQLLVNGASGIAVGMATNMMPHNLNEVCDGIIAYINNNDITIDELMEYIKAPDFPTGGTIYGIDGIRAGYLTGRGKVKVRAKANIEEDKHGRTQIIVTEIPYQVNKATLIQKTADLINEKKIEGISDIRDESDRHGIRIVYDLKRDAIPNVVLNNLYLYTALQTSYGINNIALVNGRPEVLNLKDLIKHFVDFRLEVVTKRTEYELRKAKERAHILEGYMKVIGTKADLDEAIRIIRESASPDEAREGLMTAFDLDEIQAKAVLELRLRTLTGLEIDKIRSEYEELQKIIADLEDILSKVERRLEIVRTETLEMKEKFGDERRSEIIPVGENISMEDLIANENVVVTISHLGYIKRTLLDEYKVQGRGGKGSYGGRTRDEDFIEQLFIASTHNYLLLFTEQGKCYWLKVYEIPEGTKTSKGRPIQNLLNLPQDDKVKAYINVENLEEDAFLDSHFVTMVTTSGTIKKTSLREYSRPRANGVIAITVRDHDELLEAKLTDGNSDIILASAYGYAVRFNEQDARAIGRSGMGVKGITLRADDDKVIGMVCVSRDSEVTPEIMVVSENGYGKRTFLDDPETGEAVYRITNRGGKGVKTLNITEKTGKLTAIQAVTDEHDLMIINRSGITIRFNLSELRTMGRNTQGVKLINLKEDDIIAAVSKVVREEDEENQNDNNSNENNQGTENMNEE